MQKLIDIVVQKTGLSQEQAQAAVQAVLDELKSRLPASIAGQLDALIEGGGSGLEGEVENLAKSELGKFL
jgi:polyhydroxyalkanoate synthesis regulator phasin